MPELPSANVPIDGKPITADDIMDSFKELDNEPTPEEKPVKKAKEVDDKTDEDEIDLVDPDADKEKLAEPAMRQRGNHSTGSSVSNRDALPKHLPRTGANKLQSRHPDARRRYRSSPQQETDILLNPSAEKTACAPSDPKVTR